MTACESAQALVGGGTLAVAQQKMEKYVDELGEISPSRIRGSGKKDIKDLALGEFEDHQDTFNEEVIF